MAAPASLRLSTSSSFLPPRAAVLKPFCPGALSVANIRRNPGTLAIPCVSSRRSRKSMGVRAESFSFFGSPGLKPGDKLPEDYTAQDPYSLGPPRRAGILLHPTSLPGPHGIGDFGPEAYKFIDWLADAGCTLWQVLPLVPPGRKSGEDGSPYAGQDANCGNTLLLSLDLLVKDGLLDPQDLPPPQPVERIKHEAVAQIKDGPVAKAAKKMASLSEGPLRDELEAFKQRKAIASWLEEAALFAAVDAEQGTEFWWQWPADLRDRNPEALAAARLRHKDSIEVFVAQQFLFQRQWQALHKYANGKGINIIGDMPIYVGGHSADVWANRSQFMLDEQGVPALVSGVPPDAFSATGQLWGSPLYNWRAMEDDGFRWWANRMRRAFDLYDEFRIDHFRGLAGYWSIPASAKTAMEGEWVMGPRKKFFDAIKRAVGKVDIIAEDLGVITVDVVQLRKDIQAPGMAVLQFAFGSDSKNPHLPHNHEVNQVVYPGTHDNDTVVGWWAKAQDWEKSNVRNYLHFEGDQDVHWHFIRGAVESVALSSIISLQDVLGLDNSARMNTPAVQAGNWGWRVGDDGTFARLKPEGERLRSLVKQYNRLPR